MPKKYTFTNEQIKEINEALEESKNTSEYKRIQCLKLRAENKLELQDIEGITGYDYKYVSQLISKYINKGIGEIYNKKRQANRRYISYEEEKELLSSFLIKAEKGQMLIVDDIRKAYSQRVGKETSPNGIYKVLERHGWRKVMPRSKHPKKASDEAIAAYKKNN